MKISILLSLIFLFSSFTYSSYCNISGDTVFFSTEKEGLTILTQNIDSIKYHSKKENYPNPFSPSMKDYAAKVKTYDTTFLLITIKDKADIEIKSFRWEKIIPGAYRFDWWEYMDFKTLPSGVYYAEIFSNKGVETNKALIVK